MHIPAVIASGCLGAAEALVQTFEDLTVTCAGKPPRGPVAAAATPSQDGSLAGAALRAATPEQCLQGATPQAPSLPPTPLSTGTRECPVFMLPRQQFAVELLSAEQLLTLICWKQCNPGDCRSRTCCSRPHSNLPACLRCSQDTSPTTTPAAAQAGHCLQGGRKDACAPSAATAT